MAARWVWSILVFGVLCYLAAAAPAPSSEVSSGSRKERFLISVLRLHNGRCSKQGSGTQKVEGVCQHRAECRYHKGTNLGSCAVFGACCAVERSCNNATSLLVSYFVTPRNFENMCLYRVNVNNRDICQIRLDFDEFNIAQPSKSSDPENTDAYRCLNDSFVVTSSLTGAYKLPVLCGHNTGQHMYIPVNRSQSANSIELGFHLADRSSTSSLLVTPTWKIRVTQIECSGMTNDLSSIGSALHTYNHQHFDLHLPVNDHLRLAPPGCLQYYIERAGVYESFNFNGGNGPYIGGLQYAICFRRYADVCGIRHTASKFELDYNYPLANYTDRYCDENTSEGIEMPSQDYLYIPEGFTADVIASKYCGYALTPQNYVTSVAPGPLDVFFRSDDRAYPTKNETGFRINYQMLNSGC